MEITKFDLKIPEFDIEKTSITFDSEDAIEVDGFNVQCSICISYKLSNDEIGDSSLINGTKEETVAEIEAVFCNVNAIYNDGEEVQMSGIITSRIETLIENHIVIFNINN